MDVRIEEEIVHVEDMTMEDVYAVYGEERKDIDHVTDDMDTLTTR